jgi:hypothetical protein
MTDFLARRVANRRAWDLFADGFKFGRITETGFFGSDDDELVEWVRSSFRFHGNLGLTERLAGIRRCYEGLAADRKAESDAEIWAENAWLRAAEAGTPDTWADEDRERAIEFYGYGPPA